MDEIEIRSYAEPSGRLPFQIWFADLNPQAQAKVNVSLTRLARGNRSQVKGVGGGVAELKLDYGPGYRVYFGQDGELLVILLGGGTKKRQDHDIATAKARWTDYKARKARERG